MGSTFTARAISSAEEFLQVSKGVRSAEPISTQVIGGAATAVAKGASSYSRCTWWVVEFKNDVVGVAMHTEPFNIFLSPMPREASEALAELIAVEHPDFPGVNGPPEVVSDFLKRCSEHSKEPIHFQMHQEHLAYFLDEVKFPSNIIGEARIATPIDRDLALEWFTAFALEAAVDGHNLEAVVDRAIASGRLYFWQVAGEIVSMAGHTADVEIPKGTLSRIGPVYTPPLHRKRGYASFLVSEICRRLHERGTSVMLYADANYPESNKVYINIGFKLVGSNSIWNATRE